VQKRGKIAPEWMRAEECKRAAEVWRVEESERADRNVVHIRN